jgi:hypothetical protein
VNLKNYTSGVPVDRTVARIEMLLAEAGASDVSKSYNNGRLVALRFRIEAEPSHHVTIRLPANAEAVFDTLKAEIKRPRQGTVEKLHIQAERTAWKLMQDWVEVQLSLIRLQKVEILQVFLPYIWDGNKSFYTLLRETGHAQLMLPETT